MTLEPLSETIQQEHRQASRLTENIVRMLHGGRGDH